MRFSGEISLTVTGPAQAEKFAAFLGLDWTDKRMMEAGKQLDPRDQRQ